MALLDKILYMADYIEPNRDFEGVERLRKLAYTDPVSYTHLDVYKRQELKIR